MFSYDGDRILVFPERADVPDDAPPSNFVPACRRRLDGGRDRRFRSGGGLEDDVPGPLRRRTFPRRYQPYAAPPPPPPPPAPQPNVQGFDEVLINTLVDGAIQARRLMFDLTDTIVRMFRRERLAAVIPVPPPLIDPLFLMPYAIPVPPPAPGPWALVDMPPQDNMPDVYINYVVLNEVNAVPDEEDDDVIITGHAYHPGHPAHRYN